MWPEIQPRNPRLPERVRVVEVGPRDGLQNLAVQVPTETKVGYINRLTAAGFSEIEVSSFVSPRAIPALADAAEVLAAIEQRPTTRYTVLVPNMRGLENALRSGVRAIAVFTAASDAFTQRNINATVAESLQNFVPVIEKARQEGLSVRGYMSTAFGCPYAGYVAVERVVEVAERLFALGVDEISIGDTIGVATPEAVRRLSETLAAHLPIQTLAMHFHNTRGTALANVLAALEVGIATIDAASGGLGGCPYAPGAAGNLATEDLLYMLHGMGIETGVDLAAVVAATQYLTTAIGITAPSSYVQTVRSA